MKKCSVFVAILVTVLAAGTALAIDRDAAMIDTIGIELGDYRNVDTVGVSLWVENKLLHRSDDWAIVAGIGGGNWDPNEGSDAMSLFGALGVKFYPVGIMGLSLVGSYQTFENKSDFDIFAATLACRIRMIPASHAISPYAQLSGSIQRTEFEPGFMEADGDTFNEWVIRAGLGIDFMATEEFSFVFEGGWSDSEDVKSGPQYADGYYAGIYMRYFWQ